MPRDAEDLLSNPDLDLDDGTPLSGIETPFDKTTDLLSQTRGPKLELMCRTTREIADAARVGYNLVFTFDCEYVRGMMDQIMRLSVSKDGRGRAEMVQSLQAGSGVPDSFFDTSSGDSKKGFASLEDEE